MDKDPTKLTSFQPLNPVSSSSSFSFSRFITFGRKKTSQPPRLPITPELLRKDSLLSNEDSSTLEEGSNSESIYEKKENLYTWLTRSSSNNENTISLNSSSNNSSKDKWKYRNVRTIMRRLSALTIDKRWHQSNGDFKHNFKQYWMPDEHCKECYECSDKFNTFRRRHHCRVCGQIFCSRCCSQEVPGKVMGFSGDIRVCNYCCNIVQAYLNDENFDKSIAALGEDWRIGSDHNCFLYDYGGSASSVNSAKTNQIKEDPFRMKRATSTNSLATIDRATTPIQRSPFDAFGVAPSEANNIKQDYLLRELWHQISDPRSGLELQSHRFRMKTHHNCFIGSELIDWLLTHNKFNSRSQAVKVVQGLLDGGWIACVYANEENIFKDEYMLYQPTKMAIAEAEVATMSSQLPKDDVDLTCLEKNLTDDDAEAPEWLKQITHSAIEDENESAHPVPGAKTVSARLLDLDQVPNDTEQNKTDLSIQMKLNAQVVDDDNKEPFDQVPQISLITNQPPVPLDHWTLVDVNELSKKKKIAKQNSSAVLNEDLFHGILFPRPNIKNEFQDDNAENSNNNYCERLAKDRLSAASQHHLKAMLEQLLKQDHLLLEWDKIIMPFILQVSEMVVPDVHRDDDMDIRRYVWFTKVPGGLKSDCHLINGVVFPKNVSHKRMNTVFTSPKILMMSCAIEYQRVENKMVSLDPMVLQEHAFLQNFVRRVLDLKPNILLVERNVACKAQEMLLNGGITLVHNIKPHIMENISRCTGADILPTMEQITKPRLGTCQSFRIEKFMLLNGEAKSLMYFEGCAPDLGCSLVLRGGNIKTLIKVKKIIQYLIYVAYHSKLEMKFLLDELAMPPSLDQLLPKSKSASSLQDKDNTEDGNAINVESSDSEAKKFQKCLQRIILSSSPFLTYTMPYLLTEEGSKSSCRDFISDRIYWSRYLDGSIYRPGKLREDDHEWVENSVKISSEVRIKPPHIFTDPSVLIKYIDDEKKRGKLLNDYRAQGGCIDLKMFQDYEDRERRKIYGIKMNSQTSNYLESEKTDKPTCNEGDSKELHESSPDPKLDCFDAYNHQKIAVLFSSYSSDSSNAPKPCISPWAVFMEFYGRNDITLGGFLERYCFRPSYMCPSHNCEVTMVNHVRYFAHCDSSLYIHMRNLEAPIPGYDGTILTWSWCKICKEVTSVVPLSSEAQSLSFAKYLELRFYGNSYIRRGSAESCFHSLHHDHNQYFSYSNMVASFKYRPIDLYEVIIPPHSITIGKQRNMTYLINEVEEIASKVDYVNNVIMERILDLKGEDLMTNNPRESKINDFIRDLEKEHSNIKDLLDVINSKVKSLLTNDTINNDETDNYESEGVLCDESALTNDEIQTLMLNISNKLFYLQKTICDSVYNWNIKLQDFIVQDRKREKVVRAASPVKTSVINETNEFYPENSMDMELTKPRTITRLSLKDPIAEVCLNNGTILRQTYIGTTPAVYGSSDSESTPWACALNLQSEVDGIERNSNDTVKEVNDSAITNKLGSPYTIIESSSSVQSKSPKSLHIDEMGNKEDDLEVIKNGALENETIEINDTISTNDNVDNPHLLSYLSSIDQSLDCQSICNDNEFSENRLLNTDEESNLLESEIHQETDYIEDSVNESSVMLGESATYYNSESTILLGESASHDEDTHILAKRRKIFPSFTEFPYLLEDKLEKIEYLTPNEVKAMQYARRKRVEWEQRITNKKTTPIDFQVGEGLEFEADHFNSVKDIETSDENSSKASILTASNTKTSKKNKFLNPKKFFKSQLSLTDNLSNKKNNISETLNYESDKAPVCKTTLPSPHTAAICTTESTTFHKQKLIGHRRLKSAPSCVAKNTEESLKLINELLKNKRLNVPFKRQRSHSFGLENKEQKELSQMAEAVCKEDRIDSERDDPEVLQYDEGLVNSEQSSNIAALQEMSSFTDNTDILKKKNRMDFESLDSKFTNSGESINKRGGSEKMKKIISTFLPAFTFQTIPRPFPSYMHYIAQTGVTATIIINEKEPTSLIAYTLSCQEYQNQLKNIQDVLSGVKPQGSSLHGTPILPRSQISQQNSSAMLSSLNDVQKVEVLLRRNMNKKNPVPRPNSWSGSTEINAEPFLPSGEHHPLTHTSSDATADEASDTDIMEESGKSGEIKKKDKLVDHHIKLQFQNENVAKFYCSVYYAEQFRQLRELIFPEKEERYIQSLARCKFWKATGGKSGSSFSKSLDDRFVMKQMSRLEIQSFVDFAPRYFAYINKAVKEKRPTAMAKLLGVYRIGFNNPVTNTAMRQDVLVMENLFYEKKVNKIFDLKGSVRGRYVQTSAKEDVLMDENLLEMISESPLFIRPHSKAVLSKAIYNDTEFLSSNMVMDYSLLVGIDQTNCKLVVGIIDYIRTYTWDKRLETWVKSTGILGGQGKMPTVVSPEVYRTRFTEAMQRYFLMVPDKWTGFGADLN
ncbi:1-phosphatidylinositol 3-phosphate 5-kinase isoform X3 [Hydra vulgaris]|uniref:1-phosphatidylinositol-3-phosphate 5-kinase n=1 Tax=Hydra vulgaris TaxID=6087 RepID=A0ABM4C2G7_HYDVU